MCHSIITIQQLMDTFNTKSTPLNNKKPQLCKNKKQK